jgi:hypothetical protein
MILVLKTRMGGSHHKNTIQKNPQKKILNGKIQNTRLEGKPRTRWEGIVHWDAMQILGIRG